MEWAIDCLKDCNKPLFASLCIGPRGDSAGVDPGECAVRMARAGADVVGANCLFDPFINLTVIKKMKKKLDEENISVSLMCQPLGFLCPDGGRYGDCDLEEFPYGRAIGEELAQERGRLPEGSEKSDHDLSTMSMICKSYSGKADVETQYGMRKCETEYWLNMEPATGRPRSTALSTVGDPEIKWDG